MVKRNENDFVADLIDLLITGDEYKEQVLKFAILEYVSKTHLGSKEQVHSAISVQPLFHKNFDLVAAQFKQYMEEGYQIYVSSDSKKQTDRLKAIFEDRGDNVSFTAILHTIHEGFVDQDMKLWCLTDH